MPTKKRKASKKSRGRPREFNEEQALAAAMHVFADKGYEAASLTDLTKAMGINRFSMYATFGNKEALFAKALELYSRENVKQLDACLASSTARAAMEKLLRGGVAMLTNPEAPGACLVTQPPLTATDASEETRKFVARKRAGPELALKRRFERALAEGELSSDVSAPDLARFYAVVIQGLALQSQHGGTAEELQKVVDVALAKWPSVTRS